MLFRSLRSSVENREGELGAIKGRWIDSWCVVEDFSIIGFPKGEGGWHAHAKFQELCLYSRRSLKI